LATNFRVWFGDSYDDIIYIYAAGKIFRMGILMQGEAASFPGSSAAVNTFHRISIKNQISNVRGRSYSWVFGAKIAKQFIIRRVQA
jgi:hypothetical protein